MTSKVQAHLINHAAKRGDFKLACKLALMANCEEGSNGVFIFNAYGDVEQFLTRQQWAGYLSQLAQDGFYKPSQDPEYKGHYGYIKQD